MGKKQREEGFFQRVFPLKCLHQTKKRKRNNEQKSFISGSKMFTLKAGRVFGGEENVLSAVDRENEQGGRKIETRKGS
jgi:hypothetical protein